MARTVGNRHSIARVLVHAAAVAGLAGCAGSPRHGATLEWAAPPGEEALAGYRIYFWSPAQALVCSIDVPDAEASRFQVRRLAPGEYFFSVAAYDAQGVESRPSNVLQKTVR